MAITYSSTFEFVPFLVEDDHEYIVSYVHSPVWWVASACVPVQKAYTADVPVVDYHRPTGFLDPRICVTVRKRGKEKAPEVRSPGPVPCPLPTRSFSFMERGERQVLRRLFTLRISSSFLSLSLFFRI